MVAVSGHDSAELCEAPTFLRHFWFLPTIGADMRKRLPVLLVLVSLLSGCGGGRTFDSIKKMAPVVLLVSLAAFTSRAQDRRLSTSTTR